MSPRRNRRLQPQRRHAGPRVTGETIEHWPDGDWVVRAVPGSPGKVYRCPGCDQEFSSSVAHLVCWPADRGVEERRHWHRPCWRARDRRRPHIPRARGGRF